MDMKHYILIIILGIALISDLALADGGIVVDTTAQVNLPSQKAAITWKNETEILVLSTKIKIENTTNLAWIIPIPSKTKPEVKAGDIRIFYDLAMHFAEFHSTKSGMEQYILPVIGISLIALGILLSVYALVKRKHLWLLTGLAIVILGIFIAFTFFYLGVLGSSGMGEMAAGGPAVQQIEIKKVDIYDIAILKATNATDLVGWLNGNGYIVPESATSILQEYCDKGDFYFVANKINLTNKYNTSSDIESAKAQLAEGVATPLEITFQPDKPFYPMKISSINEGDTDIEVYVTSKTPVVDGSGVLRVTKTRTIDMKYDWPGGDPYDPSFGKYSITLLEYQGDLKSLNNDSTFIEEPVSPYVCDFPVQNGQLIENFFCRAYNLNAKTSELDLVIEQDTAWRKIEVIGVLCTQNETPPSYIRNYEANPIALDGFFATGFVSKSGTSYLVKCTDASGNLPSDTSVGAVYSGKIYIEYTEFDPYFEENPPYNGTGKTRIVAGTFIAPFGNQTHYDYINYLWQNQSLRPKQS